MYFTPKVKLDGYTFDSEAEAEYYKLLKADKGVSGLAVHPVFMLQPGFTNADGKAEKPINYEADFSFRKDGRTHVVDVKGFIGQDDSFPLHRKMFDYQRRAEMSLEVLRYSKKTGFVPWDEYSKRKRAAISELRKAKTAAERKVERMKYIMKETASLEAKESKTPFEKGRLTRLLNERKRLLS